MYGNILKQFLENSKTVEFPKCKPFNRKILENLGEKFNKTEILKNLGIPREVLLFSRNIPINSDPFVTENFQKFTPEFLVHCKSPLVLCFTFGNIDN